VKIIAVTPTPGGRDVARADIEVAEGIRLFDVRITQAGDGYRVYGRSASFTPKTANAISSAVISHMERVLNDRRS
jgi:hypothetical protein